MFKVKAKMQKIVNGGENMRKLVLLIVVTALLVSLVVLPGCPPPPDPEVHVLRIQSGFPRGDISMELLEVFADSAYERSGGRLRIEVFAAPEIVPLGELFGATKAGTVDMLQAAGVFWGGFVPVAELEFGFPFAYDIPEKPTFGGKAEEIRRFFFEDGFVDILRREYAKNNLYWLDMHTYGPLTLHSKRDPGEDRIVTMEYFAGQRVRGAGLWEVFHEKLGMVGTPIPPGEVYMALAMCILDATQWDVSAITGLRWHEPAPYWIHPHRNEFIVGHILVNMDSWNALPADLQEALKGAAQDYWEANVETYEAALMEAYVTPGVVVVWMDEATEAVFRAKALELWDELAARDPANAEAIALIKEWRGMT
jgi:TRAP-type C4-dicarboxylate transport system substrate-binding protein